VRKSRIIPIVALGVMFVAVFGAVLIRKQIESAAVLQLDRELSSLSSDAYRGDLREWSNQDYYVALIKSVDEREDLIGGSKEERPGIPLGSSITNPSFVRSESGREWRAALTADSDDNLLLVAVDASVSREIIREGAVTSYAVAAAVIAGVLVMLLLYFFERRPTGSKTALDGDLI
jgi:hypothetical protein